MILLIPAGFFCHNASQKICKLVNMLQTSESLQCYFIAQNIPRVHTLLANMLKRYEERNP